MMVNWEFFDNQTPESASELVDDLRAGKRRRRRPAAPPLCTFKEVVPLLAGFPDGRADEGAGAAGAGDACAGLRARRSEHGAGAPTEPRRPDADAASPTTGKRRS